MKSKYLIFIISITLFQSCEQTGEISRQLRFMGSLASQYGGQWNGSTLNDCYELEITNSEILNPDTDSLEYHATSIGRALIDSLNYNFDCITLELVDEKSIGIASKSNSISASFDLNLIRRFKNKSIDEFLVIRKAYNSMMNSYRGNVGEAQNWLNDLSVAQMNHPFVTLAKAEMLRAEDKTEESLALVNSISSRYPKEPQLHKYLSYYFIESKDFMEALKHAQIAYELEPKNAEILTNITGIYQETKEWNLVNQLTTEMIDLDTNNLNAYYMRAYSAFQINQFDNGCADLATIFKRDPTIVFADSMSNYCK